MAKFANSPTRLSAPIQAADTVPTIVTHEGASAYKRDPKSELFLLATTNMVSESTFYEMAGERDRRFVQLIHTVTKTDPDWMQEFIPWLRKGAFMRSASVMAAAEYVKAGGPNGRQLINKTLTRADEPGEMLAYWFSTHGRALPAAVKRGVADAAQRLFTERNALKYDGKANAWRFGDVIQLAHVKPKDKAQSKLFKYLLDRRYGAEVDVSVRDLPVIAHRLTMEDVTPEHRRDHLPMLTQDDTWEWLSGWLPGGMDARAWEAIIPSMGYMALLRNLRNFDQAGINDTTRAMVAMKLSDPDEVARSRQFPYRFWSAYKNTGSVTYAPAIETALNLSTKNIPEIGGRTLVLVDTSASMRNPVSQRSKVAHFEIGGVFGAALAAASEEVTLVSWADRWTDLRFSKGDSVLRTVDKISRHIGHDGHGTRLRQALGAYDNHDRVVVFSDMQVMDWMDDFASPVPFYAFNTGGYAPVPFKVGNNNIYELGGFTDAVFRMIPLVESQGRWPWEKEGTK